MDNAPIDDWVPDGKRRVMPKESYKARQGPRPQGNPKQDSLQALEIIALHVERLAKSGSLPYSKLQNLAASAQDCLTFLKDDPDAKT